MAFLRSVGGFDESPNTVTTPETLSLTLPNIRFTNEMLIALYIAGNPGGAVAVQSAPAGWTQIVNVGTNMKIAVYAKLVDGTETAPSLTFSGLTTSPAMGLLYNIAGLQQSVTGLVDVAGAALDQAASSTIQAGGAAITTVTANVPVFLIAARMDDDIVGGMDTPPATEFPWTRLDWDFTTSGTDIGFEMYWGTKATPGAIAQKTLNLVGATSDASTGVMFALKPGPPIYSPYMSIV